MIIKKYQAKTETEAIMLAKAELGKDAIVMNIKTISPKGIYKLFRKPSVEITAAVDDYSLPSTKKDNVETNSSNNSISDQNTNTISTTPSAIEMKLNNLQSLLEQQMSKHKSMESIKEEENEQTKEKPVVKVEEDYKNLEYIKLVYNQLLNNEVDEKYINQIFNEIENKLKKDASIDLVLATIYQKIVLKLGQPKTIEVNKNKQKIIFFIGPTGVGKTTTIAKLASYLTLKTQAKVALLTSDTYRIAAVEQLRTYANILSIPMKVIYSEEAINEAKEELNDYDLILVDTPGHSHRSMKQKDDVERFIDSVDEDSREVYMVLSSTTKYNDLITIVNSYSNIKSYRLLFTKLDETTSIGNILNIKMLTNAELSYTTHGQNVPDDIGKIDTQELAKKLLGGNT